MAEILEKKKIKWEVRALIVTLVLSVVANVISLPIAWQKYTSGEIDKKTIALEILELKNKKDIALSELDSAKTKYETDIQKITQSINEITNKKQNMITNLDSEVLTLEIEKKEIQDNISTLESKIVLVTELNNRYLDDWDLQFLESFDVELRKAFDEAKNIRRNANAQIKNINETAMERIREKYKVPIVVEAIKKDLSKAIINGNEVKENEILNDVLVYNFKRDRVVFKIIDQNYPEQIEFSVKLMPYYLTDNAASLTHLNRDWYLGDYR
jgi:hypothetical protein